MLPRISLRRIFLCLVIATGLVLILVNIHQDNLWTSDTPEMQALPHQPQQSDEEQAAALAKLKLEQEHNRVSVDEEDLQEYEIGENNNNNINNNNNNVNAVVEEGHIDGEANGVNQEDERAQKELAEDLAAGVTEMPPMSDEDRPWFMSGGRRQPMPAAWSRKTGRRIAKLWPQEQPGSDRITNQLMFVPPTSSNYAGRLKKILIYNGIGSWGLKEGRDYFQRAGCPVDTCTITADKSDAINADAILYKDHFVSPGIVKPPKQVWILYFLECPYHTQHVKSNDVINWTATYRRDSDIVAPYERWAYYDDRVKQKLQLDRNYAANKTKKVAWFVSNCGARNHRLPYAHELEKYISVDIYGACGTKKCPRSTANTCLDMLDHDYKFYLAFENSNCKDYITEKFYVNGLGRNVLPIVMGARPEDYARNAPYRSYLHVDDFESPKALAEYLHRLDQDDDLYNSYFRWKGTGEFINTYFFCRMCALLHDEVPVKHYRDVNDWWRGPGTCTAGDWKKTTKD